MNENPEEGGHANQIFPIESWYLNLVKELLQI